MAHSVACQSEGLATNEEEPLVEAADAVDARAALVGRKEKLVQEAIDRIGFGRFHGLLFAVCGLGWSADVAEIFSAGLLMPVLKKEFGLSSGAAGLVSSVTMAGMLVGSWAWGTVGDVLGRKTTFFWTSLLTCVFGVASAATSTFPGFLVCRFLVGVCLGGNLPVDFSLFLEWTPTTLRDSATIALTGWSVVGTLFATFLGSLTLGAPSEDADGDGGNWRAFLVGLASLSAAASVCRPVVPESPRFLIVSGQAAACAAALARVARLNRVELDEACFAGLVADAEPSHGSDPDEPLEAALRPCGAWVCGEALRKVRSLFADRHSQITTWLLVGVWLSAALGFYGFSTWAPSMLIQVAGARQTYTILEATTIVQVLSLIVAATASRRAGLAYILACYLALNCLAVVWFWAVPTKVGMIVAYSLFNAGSAGFFALLYLYTNLCYATQVRTTGFGFCAAANRVGGILAPVAAGLLFDRLGRVVTLVFGACFAVSAVLTLVLAGFHRRTRL